MSITHGFAPAHVIKEEEASLSSLSAAASPMKENMSLKGWNVGGGINSRVAPVFSFPFYLLSVTRVGTIPRGGCVQERPTRLG